MLTTRFLAGARTSAALFAKCAARAEQVWVATAWASDGSAVADALWRARGRIESLVVGLDFHQTDPKFLRRFRPWARVYQSADGTFHPKVYVFRRGRTFDAIVGSSNLTRAGFGDNIEANLHVTGATTETSFTSLVRFIEDLAHDAEQWSERRIDHYEKEWRKARRDIKRLRNFKPAPKRGGSGGAAPSLHVDWKTFARELSRAIAPRAPAGSGDSFRPGPPDNPGYIGVVTEVQRLFTRHRQLAQMKEVDRLKVGGLIDPYGHFGRMTGAGLFNHYMRAEPKRLDRALDHIPAKPSKVSEDQFHAFVTAIKRTKGLGRPAVGSRLLAMKRPDVFMCLDSATLRKTIARGAARADDAAPSSQQAEAALDRDFARGRFPRISGHLRERMREHDSTVTPVEQRESICRVLRLVHSGTKEESAPEVDGEHVAPGGPSGMQVAKEARISGAPQRIRTSDLRLRRPSLYPAELVARLGSHLLAHPAGDPSPKNRAAPGGKGP
jgi:hypothetical protein